ncbi:hypothetical protein VTK26DRAFT_4357 [Humicola hyalothermophila]
MLSSNDSLDNENDRLDRLENLRRNRYAPPRALRSHVPKIPRAVPLSDSIMNKEFLFEIYSGCHLDALMGGPGWVHHAMGAAFNRVGVKQYFFEGPSPPVVLLLAFPKVLRIEGRDFSGCILSVNRVQAEKTDRTNLYHPDGAASCRIQLVGRVDLPSHTVAQGMGLIPQQRAYLGSSITVYFAADGRRTVRDVVEVVCGTHRNLPFDMIDDLTRFCFHLHTCYEGGTRKGVFFGRRDWISQVFVRLHYLGWVEWERIAGIEFVRVLKRYAELYCLDDKLDRFRLQASPPGDNSTDGVINWATAGFHHVIGTGFWWTPPRTVEEEQSWQNGPKIITYWKAPIRMGWFYPGVTRFFRSQAAPIRELPYEPYGAGSTTNAGSQAKPGSHSEPSLQAKPGLQAKKVVRFEEDPSAKPKQDKQSSKK